MLSSSVFFFLTDEAAAQAFIATKWQSKEVHKSFDSGEYSYLMGRAVKFANLIMQKIIFVSWGYVIWLGQACITHCGCGDLILG